ncbi:MAG: enoyl-CoA hydratase/isomerase family protein [Candidatus Hatepunaea meridiana]|nr:enoyl-CoA hydratase/isomerase family protein [Candidatus Hatepunaea meridiana]
MSDYRFIKFSRKQNRADLIFNRSPRNLLNHEMLEEIVDALGQTREDESLKVLTIRGASGSFCGGLELQERTSERVGLIMPLFTRMFDYLNEIRGLTIAAVEGEASDGGFDIAAFCDILIATESSTFCHPEVSFGHYPPIATAILPRLVGRNRALDWIISGDRISSREAHRAGLVNRLVREGELIEEMERYADKIASYSAPAVIWAKRAIDRSLYTPAMEAMRTSESTYMIDLLNNIDPHEGLKAAIEGRLPKWRDK